MMSHILAISVLNWDNEMTCVTAGVTDGCFLLSLVVFAERNDFLGNSNRCCGGDGLTQSQGLSRDGNNGNNICKDAVALATMHVRML